MQKFDRNVKNILDRISHLTMKAWFKGLCSQFSTFIFEFCSFFYIFLAMCLFHNSDFRAAYDSTFKHFHWVNKIRKLSKYNFVNFLHNNSHRVWIFCKTIHHFNVRQSLFEHHLVLTTGLQLISELEFTFTRSRFAGCRFLFGSLLCGLLFCSFGGSGSGGSFLLL